MPVNIIDDVVDHVQPVQPPAEGLAVGAGLAGAWINIPPPPNGNELQGVFQAKKIYKPTLKAAPINDNEITIQNFYGCGNEILGNASVFYAGLECEIEAIQKGKNIPFHIFGCKEDHSLRNNGWEYVSSPETRGTLVEGFKLLQEFLNLDMAKDPFSYRTSVHVHVNAASMTGKQAKNMLLLYALFEEFFFSLAKPERRNNIHCVPLTDTHLPNRYHKDIFHLKGNWTKYAALNITRLNDLGTFEFRHLHGTGDVEEIGVWLKILDNLWTLSRQVVIDEASLSDPVRIYSWFDTIFNPSSKTMMLGGQLHNIIQNSLIDVKFSAIKE